MVHTNRSYTSQDKKRTKIYDTKYNQTDTKKEPDKKVFEKVNRKKLEFHDFR